MPDADPTGRPGMPGTGPEQTEHEQTGEREGRADARRHAGCGGLDMHLPQPTTYRAKTAEGSKTTGRPGNGGNLAKRLPPLKEIEEIGVESARWRHASANRSTSALIQSSRLAFSFGICSVSSTIGTLTLLAAPVI